MNARRALLVTALSVAGAWTALVLVYGGLHFDDFVNLAESRGALSLSAAEWLKPAADGRWQPLKRITFDLLAQTVGLTFWPYALALACAHLLMAAGAAVASRAIWHDRERSLQAGVVALASLNLSAYSIANVGSLHGVLCVALAVWSVACALQGAGSSARRGGWLTASALAAVAACLFKESAVTVPALACYAVWLASRVRRMPTSAQFRAVAAPAAGVAVYLVARLAFDVPLIPAESRYKVGSAWPIVRNALVVVAGVLPWALAVVLTSGRQHASQMRSAGVEVLVMVTAGVAVAFPSLLLPWTSPNFWYAATPVAALGTAGLLHRASQPARAMRALALMMLLALTGVSAAAFTKGVHRWGPWSELSLRQFLTFPRHGGRVVWFDLDTHAGYGGLVRTVGPGGRLTQALRLATGDQSLEAETCIAVRVAPPYVPLEGDELYLHSAGRLQPIADPPGGTWYCPR